MYHEGVLKAIEDKKKDKVRGTFYEGELQRVDYDEKGEYFIDQVIRTTKYKDKPNEQVLVSWVGWPKKFNSEILKSAIFDY